MSPLMMIKMKTKMRRMIKISKKRRWKKGIQMDSQERSGIKKWRAAMNKVNHKTLKTDMTKSYHQSKNNQNKWMNE
jgi:hypothetical protein